MIPISVLLRNSLRKWTMAVSIEIYRRFWGMDIGVECKISHKAILDKSNPGGIHIGRYTGVALNAIILSHDFVRNKHVDTWIGERCHIGAGAIIGPGVRIGDGCLIAAGSVVLKDVPDNCIVMGNPARVIEQGLRTGKWGVRVDILAPDRIDQNVLLTGKEEE
jgi:acetyltransferase-like isoleucine patch superfamily enzyme